VKKNLSDYLVALAVIGCSIVLLAALTIALSGWHLKKPERTLQIDYADVTGIHLASELRYAGAQAGHVVGIRLLTSEERKADSEVEFGAANAVRVTVEINNDVPPIPDDAVAGINADTLLAEKFISLSAGSPIGSAGKNGKPVQQLADSAVLQGHPNGLDKLLNGGGDLIPQINDLLASLQGDMKDVVPKLDTVLDSAKKALADGDSLLTNANGLIGDKGTLRATLDEIHDAVGKMQGIEDNLNGVLTNANGLVTTANGDLDGRMKELAVVLENLKVATTYMKSFTKQLAEKPNRVIFSATTQKQPQEQDIIKSQKPVPTQ
jgi:ABC-type transporter Mla subunit MlaD